MTIEDLASAWAESPRDGRAWLVRLLRDEGTDLMQAGEPELRRGTPVYVEASVPVGDVQRRMARYHIRMLPVLSEGEVLGIVDLVDLAMDDDLAPDVPIGEAIR